MPQNEGYYHAAYALSAIVYVAYVASIWWRARTVERRER
jgi:hypothetical protein